MSIKSNNISRNLPKVLNTGNSLLNAWLMAASEIINDLRARTNALEDDKNNARTDNQSADGQSDMTGYERVENRVSIIDENEGRDKYPSVFAVKNYITNVLNGEEKAIFDIWEIENQSFGDLEAISGDKLRIVGGGEYDGIELRDGDVVEVYKDADDQLKIFLLVNSQGLTKNSNTDDLDEGVENLYFTELRVLSTVLNGLVESTDEIEVTDSILVALGKAKGHINHLQQQIDAIQLDMADKLNIADLMDALKDTVPSATGTYIMKSVDGVLSWELQP